MTREAMNPQDMIAAAKGIVNVGSGKGTVFNRRWMSAFGAYPDVCCILWNEVKPHSTMPNGVEPKHLLWGLIFLNIYDTEENIALRVGDVDEKTFRKWSHLFVDAISYLECEVVSSYFNNIMFSTSFPHNHHHSHL